MQLVAALQNKKPMANTIGFFIQKQFHTLLGNKIADLRFKTFRIQLGQFYFRRGKSNCAVR
jgi:hypothetical protein